MTDQTIEYPRIAGREEWLAARRALLEREKRLTRERDAVSAARRQLPMLRVEKDYRFETAEGGQAGLAELFGGRRQLIVYHFMFDPGDPPPGKSEPYSEGCSGCSFMADNLPHLAHLHARDTALALVSRAPQRKIRPFRARMGWDLPWYSSCGSDFNYDFHVTTDPAVTPVEYNYQDADTLRRKDELYHLEGEQPGFSVFLRDGGQVFHTYSTYGRGLDPMVVTYQLLDLTPFGRGEGWGGMPDLGQGLFWTRHHDRYGDATADACCKS